VKNKATVIPTRNWQLLHNHKEDANKNSLRDKVMKVCSWSRATFYLKLQSPEKISLAEKKAICEVYDTPMEMLFPDN